MPSCFNYQNNQTTKVFTVMTTFFNSIKIVLRMVVGVNILLVGQRNGNTKYKVHIFPFPSENEGKSTNLYKILAALRTYKKDLLKRSRFDFLK